MHSSTPKSWKECIKHFTPAWHTVVMGTGATSALVNSFPYGKGHPAIKVVALIIYFFNVAIFLLISAATVLRYITFPEIWEKMLHHPAQSLFLGAIPMAFATLINIALAMHQENGFGGKIILYILWICWWFDSIASFLCAFGMVYTMSTSQSHSLSRMAAVWLLPVVTLIVASSTGGLLSAALRPESATLATLTTALSFTMVTIGLSLAIMMITVYLARLICYGPPDANLILSAFLVLGPLGQGGYSLLLNGSDLAELLPLYTTNQFPGMSQSGQIVYAVCFCAAYILWSMGICWIIIAICSIFSVAKSSGLPPFGLAYWGLIFPNGVFALLSIQLGVVLQSPFFHGFGALWSCITFALWLGTLVRTVPAILDRSIFNAPCLAAVSGISGRSEQNTSTVPCVVGLGAGGCTGEFPKSV